MDSKERREAPTDFQLRTKYRLELRSKAIQKVLWSKRIPQQKNQGIKGYDISKYFHKKKFKIKKCLDCDSICHLRANWPVHRESQLRKRVSELERRIDELEAAYFNQIDNKKKRDKRKRKRKNRRTCPQRCRIPI